jgi:hypothetical protein
MGKRRTDTPEPGKSEPRGSPGLRTRARRTLAEKGFAGISQADMERLVHELSPFFRPLLKVLS